MIAKHSGAPATAARLRNPAYTSYDAAPQRRREVARASTAPPGAAGHDMSGHRRGVYTEHATIVFGRQAKPGEQYESSTQADAPGEVMHGLAFRGRTVADVLAMLRKRHVTVPEYRYEGPDQNTAYPNGLRPDQVKPTWYVHGAVPWANDQVLLFVGPTRQVHADPPQKASKAQPAATPTAG